MPLFSPTRFSEHAIYTTNVYRFIRRSYVQNVQLKLVINDVLPAAGAGRPTFAGALYVQRMFRWIEIILSLVVCDQGKLKFS